MNFSNFYHSSKSAKIVKSLTKVVNKATAQAKLFEGRPLPELLAAANRLRAVAPAQHEQPTWLAELLALTREVGSQVLGMRLYDVQLLGGLVLWHGKLAEMRTGEGKTITIAAPCIAAAFTGQPVHVVTVNEYLAQRDAEALRPLYEALGLTVGVIRANQPHAEKQAAYACDVVYGVNHEFGFDYLRDNMVMAAEARVQRGLGFAVVDEVDSILIDEARTPLIISGMAPDFDGSEIALGVAVSKLTVDVDYIVDERERSAVFTDQGYQALEASLVEAGVVRDGGALYKGENLALLQHAGQSLLAQTLYHRDKHYVVNSGEIVIVDESTGRLMTGRRWGEGLHEALEAKEGLKIKARTLTQASITYQNYFHLYNKLAGLTGTASTEAEEFVEIYGLATVIVPTNKPMVRADMADIVFGTRKEKFAAIVAEVADRHEKGQPVLIGTASVTDSERLSKLLTQAGLAHAVLNARQNAQEADVVACAGLPGAVTVATNMAGRGTDILLGGHREGAGAEWATRRNAVIAAGGLHVIGSERHESRRIDNQLRGRAGRQGDVGSSQFFLSLEDNLLRVFAAERQGVLSNLVEKGTGLSSPLLDKIVTLAQKRMEEQGFQARRELMKFDQVLASQRLAVYTVRNELLEQDKAGLAEQVNHLSEDAADSVSKEWLATEWLDENFDVVSFKGALRQTFGVVAPVVAWVHQRELEPKEIRAEVRKLVRETVSEWVVTQPPADVCTVLLQTLDQEWRDHLTRLDELRVAIGLRAMAQQNPVFAFAIEARQLFQGIKPAWAFAAVQRFKEQTAFAAATHGDAGAAESLNGAQRVQLALFQRFVTRNEICPCGSGLRFKLCHGRL